MGNDLVSSRAGDFFHTIEEVGTVVGVYLANIPATDATTVGDQERLYPARFFLTLLQTRIQ